MPMITLEELKKIPANWDTLFPASKEDPPANVFELGLVMGGTVSAGAYTAGVVDFLVEALDAWSAAKANKEPDVATWDTRLKVVTGTSGGGVTGAILGRALSFDFPHVRLASLNAEQMANPFYRVWVRNLDISGMLETGDLKDKPFKSLLNGAPLDVSATDIAQFQSENPAMPQKIRAYVDNPLPTIMTVTNMRGIPTRIDFGSGGLSQGYVTHADFVRYAVFTRGGSNPIRPDEFGVSSTPGTSGFVGWDVVAKSALATGAFPGGLPARDQSRPLSHYRYRPFSVPVDTTAAARVRQLPVAWEAILGNQTTVEDRYDFLCVDGGVMDNEPIELCRQVLAGIYGRNPRDSRKACRGVLLVDPFAESPTLGDKGFSSLPTTLFQLLGAWKDEARYDTRDLLLAADADCFSRFMITARRGNFVGSRAIATANTGAFGGFLCEAYRRHDYLLGRKNCQEYLRTELVAHRENPLFSNWLLTAPAEVVNEFAVTVQGETYLPLIPLYGSCREVEQLEPWPKGKFDPRAKDFQKKLKARVSGVLDCLADSVAGDNRFVDFLLKLVADFGDDKLCDVITDKLLEELGAGPKGWDLL